jgi:hypothetical protein
LAHRKDISERCGVVFAFDAAPMAEDVIARSISMANREIPHVVGHWSSLLSEGQFLPDTIPRFAEEMA